MLTKIHDYWYLDFDEVSDIRFGFDHYVIKYKGDSDRLSEEDMDSDEVAIFKEKVEEYLAKNKDADGCNS